MAIILTSAEHTVELPDDMGTEGLYPLITTGTVMQFTMSGTVITQQTRNRKGQQIKLIAEGDKGCWLTYAVVQQLEAMINAGGTFTISIHSTVMNAAWANEPITATPVVDMRPPLPTTPFAVTLSIIRI